MKKIVALLMAMLVFAACLAGCASKTGTPMMTLKKTELTENVFSLYLSRTKGTLCSAYVYGADALNDTFWDTKWDAEGKTYNEHYTDLVLQSAKNTLAALHVFEEKKLKLPKSTLEEIDKDLEELMEQDAGGSRAEFDSILAEYGANYDVLREAYVIEAKVNYLMDTLLGADGSLMGKEWINEYYEENYARFKQVFFYTSKLVYETDEDGQEIYYTSSGKIAYDTSAKPKTNAAGEAVKDANGDPIYLREDGKVAYDITKGVRRQKKDADGNPLREDLKGEELQAVLNQSKTLYQETMAGDTVGFEELIEEYNEDEAMAKYPNGYYMTADTRYDSPEVVKKLFEIQVGEVAWVRSDYGVHIIMRYELEKDGYDLETNQDFFKNRTTGTYLFLNELKNLWMNEYLEPYKKEIEILDEAVFDRINIKNVGANFYY
ncbi:MAG: hypothetical protein E7642_07545 [Ruminococcaceae bacterium]|nr:hypothetical protein [Oscillospiraceae bacterium]